MHGNTATSRDRSAQSRTRAPQAGRSTAQPWAIGLAALAVAANAAAPAHGLDYNAHKRATAATLAVLKRLDPDAYGRLAAAQGRSDDVRKARRRNQAFERLAWTAQLETEAAEVDNYRDLEFIDVEGGIGSGGRDDPHRSELTALDDKAHLSEGKSSYTAFNHFIDVRKRASGTKGLFDDYDGYSYHKGSGSVGEHQPAEDAASGPAQWIAGKVTGHKVDAGVAGYWFNDEYVHAPGQPWYRDCSPAVQRYSFPADLGRYATVDEEAVARFPLANSTGAQDRGVPYSVFMPVDNMARYWYSRFVSTGDLLCLGPVLHAVQDAAIPHHAAGCLGNWHGAYEKALSGARIDQWLGTREDQAAAAALAQEWSWQDPSPPTSLAPEDYGRKPAANWSVHMLVTRLALNAHHEYATTYQGFRTEQFDPASARKLTTYAAAMGALILRRAVAAHE